MGRVRRHKALLPRPVGLDLGEGADDPNHRAGYKARLVVQEHQEDRHAIRSDSPTGSRDALSVTLAAASQTGWATVSMDAHSPYLQAGSIERLLLLRMPLQNAACPAK